MKDENQMSEAEQNQAGKAAVKKNRIVRDKIDADAALNRAQEMSKLELFLLEEATQEPQDYGVFRDRIAAIVEAFHLSSEDLTIFAIHKICAKIDEARSREEEDDKVMGFNGFKKLGDKPVEKPIFHKRSF